MYITSKSSSTDPTKWLRTPPGCFNTVVLHSVIARCNVGGFYLYTRPHCMVNNGTNDVDLWVQLQKKGTNKAQGLRRLTLVLA